MNKLPLIAIVIFIAAGSAFAQPAPPAPDAAALTKLLNEFLAGASRGDVSVHERFWADDLIYTRSAGRRVSKADVLHDVRNAPPPKPTDPVYTAEDIRIQQYGDTAIVAFRLVATSDTGGTKSVANLLNSGTFVKRNGKWQVVNWQSTRMPRTEEESKREVGAILQAFHKSPAPEDATKLRSLIDDKFVWNQRDGKPKNQQEFMDDLISGQVKFAIPGTQSVNLSVYGDTVVARGELERSRSGKHERMRYIMTFVNQIGGWKLMALDTN
jgi:ketosteroid isomerase-like protein